MMTRKPHETPDAWLGTTLQIAIHDLAIVNGYGDSLSIHRAGRDRPSAAASIAVTSHGPTLLFRPLKALEPNSFSALIPDRKGNLVWREDTDHSSYYEAYDLARRAFARLRRLERESGERDERAIPRGGKEKR